MRGLRDKVVVITGAAGGIGRSLCQRFCEEGARVVGLDRDRAGLEKLRADLHEHEDRMVLAELDITDHAAVASTIQKVHADEKRIDVLVNNAGWDVPMQFLETSPEFWNKVIAINLLGPLNLHHAVLPFMVADGGGKVVNIASDAGRVGSSGESVYSACKGGITAFSKTVAREYARQNIRVNVVCPGRPTPPSSGRSSEKVSTDRRSTTAWSARSRSSVWGSRVTSPASSPSSPARTPTSSPVKSCRSPAG